MGLRQTRPLPAASPPLASLLPPRSLPALEGNGHSALHSLHVDTPFISSTIFTEYLLGTRLCSGRLANNSVQSRRGACGLVPFALISGHFSWFAFGIYALPIYLRALHILSLLFCLNPHNSFPPPQIETIKQQQNSFPDLHYHSHSTFQDVPSLKGESPSGIPQSDGGDSSYPQRVCNPRGRGAQK